MINVKSRKDSVTGYVVGSLNELMADTAMIMRYVYQAVKSQSEEAAKEFEYCLKKSFEDGVLFCEDEDLGDICKGSVEDLKKKAEDANAKDEIKNMLNEVIKEIEDLDNIMKDMKGLAGDGK